METALVTLPQLPIAGDAPERKDAAANRDRILCAARRILEEQGAEALSMDAVAAAAGVGKGTIFRRFGDRAGLTDALLNEYMRALQDGFLSGPPPLGPGAPPAQRLRAFIVALVRLQRDNLAIAIAAQPRDGRPYPNTYGALHVHVRVLIAAIDPTLRADVVATLILGAVSPPVLNQLRDADLDSIAASVTALLDGVGREPA